jgi:hypothetical protein
MTWLITTAGRVIAQTDKLRAGERIAWWAEEGETRWVPGEPTGPATARTTT